jgi:hypothetical protein
MVIGAGVMERNLEAFPTWCKERAAEAGDDAEYTSQYLASSSV